jgi:flavodoxin
MKLKKILLIAVAVVIVVVLGAFAFMGAIIFDVNGNLAGGSETLSPAGNITGHALVVYNPGVTGAAKNIASTIANDLKAQGYSVVMAGVKSQTATDVSSYDVIVMGGPIYAGSASSSVKAYLESLHPASNATIGVFGHGSVEQDNGDKAAVLEDVASLPANSTLNIKAALKLTPQEDMDKGCADFVARLLK